MYSCLPFLSIKKKNVFFLVILFYPKLYNVISLIDMSFLQLLMFFFLGLPLYAEASSYFYSNYTIYTLFILAEGLSIERKTERIA